MDIMRSRSPYQVPVYSALIQSSSCSSTSYYIFSGCSGWRYKKVLPIIKT